MSKPKTRRRALKLGKNKIELLNMQMIFLYFLNVSNLRNSEYRNDTFIVTRPSLWNQLIAKVDSFHWGWEWGLKDATIYPQAGFKSDMSVDFGTLLFRSWYGCKLHPSWRGHMFNRYPQSEIDVFNTYSKILNPFKGMRGAIKVCQQALFEAVLCLFCDLL